LELENGNCLGIVFRNCLKLRFTHLASSIFFLFGGHRFEHRSALVAMAPFKRNKLTQRYTAPVCNANFSIVKQETHLLL
jgi:hypothetical protein